ncbi:hypothetical protein QYE76_052267 [Lolium multiflorum]|uniref:DUF4283 domain-containing protein n=1 Tax=Lolium multiflorum TaxID=4521 RepID=A0AAD8STG0_LOLMU|nr:hypothetical protein QYE76_052267 [Lolium multiflorum]
MEKGGSSRGGKGKEEEDVDALLRRLQLREDDGDDFVWEEEAGSEEVKAKWLAIARVHTDKGFSPSALYAEMRSAWNLAKEVRWRMLEDNLFTVQFGCLGDWNTAIQSGPWLFRNHALIIKEYDGFENPRSVKLDKIAAWVRVLKLPDNYLKEAVIKGMCRKMGAISEVQIKLPVEYVGAFVRVKVDLDVNKQLERFVSITRGGQKDWYQVKYEKLPVFCNFCGLIGHAYDECGTGEHDVSKFEWGDFILADEWRNRVGARGSTMGRGSSGGGPARGGGLSGRGFGRGNVIPGEFNNGGSWRFNAKNNQTGTEGGLIVAGGTNPDLDMYDGSLGKKRPTVDSSATEEAVQNPPGSLVVSGGSKVANMVDKFDEVKGTDPLATPQKNANKKKHKGVDGGAMDSTNSGSAASFEDDRREQ